MRPFSRTHTTLNRAALATPRTNEERGKQRKRLISTTVGTKRSFRLQKAREKLKGSFHPFLLLRTHQVTSRRSGMLPSLRSHWSNTTQAEERN